MLLQTNTCDVVSKYLHADEVLCACNKYPGLLNRAHTFV